MFLPFRHLTSRQSVGYAVLCAALMGGIKWLDERTPTADPLKDAHDRLAWSDIDDHAARQQPHKHNQRR